MTAAVFHAITAESWRQAHQELTSSERSVYFLIASQAPFGDRRVECSSRSLAEQLNLGKSTVSDALRELVRKVWIEVEKVGTVTFAKICHISAIAQAYLAPESDEGSVPESGRVSLDSGKCPVSGTPHLINKYSPHSHTSEADERESEVLVERLTGGGSQPETQAAIATPPTPSVKTPPPVINKSPERPTKRETGSASNSKSPWVEGPWLTASGQLDGAFVDEVANKWVRLYGGYLHERRVHVISHFAKNPGINLPKEWQWYEEEFATRARSAQQTHEAGMKVEQDRIDRLVANQRALTARMSEEQRLVAEPVAPVAIAEPVAGELPAAPAAAGGCEQAIASTFPPQEGKSDLPKAIAPVAETVAGQLRAGLLRLLNQWLLGTAEQQEKAIAWRPAHIRPRTYGCEESNCRQTL